MAVPTVRSTLLPHSPVSFPEWVFRLKWNTWLDDRLKIS